MFKIILKNLWNRRGKNVWLFIELILVTVLCWYILDPAFVSIADSSMSVGYDADRLVSVDVNTFPESAACYSEASADSAASVADFYAFSAKLERMPEVECISQNYDGCGLNDQSLSLNTYRSLTPRDTIVKSIIETVFLPGTKYFETMGIKSVPGSPSSEQLSQEIFNYDNGIIITRDVAEMYWPGENAVGKYFGNVSDNGDTVWTRRVCGVVENVRYQSFLRTNMTGFSHISDHIMFPLTEFRCVVRLKAGVDVDEFARNIIGKAPEFITGNYYIKAVTPYSELIRRTEDSFGIRYNREKQILVGLFFLLNLIVGVVGSFFFQVERRVSEVGIHRSYGATRCNIMTMLVGEGVMLAAVAFIIGDLLYMQYALKYGLEAGFGNNLMFNMIDCWQGNFWQHFAMVSSAILVLILLCTLIGSLIPAWKASRIDPAKALKDE